MLISKTIFIYKRKITYMKLNIMILLILSNTALQASDPVQRMIADQAARQAQREAEIRRAQQQQQAQREADARMRALQSMIKYGK